jgi:hypothetical protein
MLFPLVQNCLCRWCCCIFLCIAYCMPEIYMIIFAFRRSSCSLMCCSKTGGLFKNWVVPIFFSLFIMVLNYFPLAHTQVDPFFQPFVCFFILFPVDMLAINEVKICLQSFYIFHQSSKSYVYTSLSAFYPIYNI